MFGSNDQQSQDNNPTNGFSPNNFTPPTSISSPPLNNTQDFTMPPASNTQTPATSAPGVPTNPLDTPEISATSTPDSNTSQTSSSNTASTVGGDNSLLDLKQQALQQLSPLVDQLDQTPEEKFRTTMMMIQASDDQSLLKTAYDAAQAITDEKERAQALLDVINEINYFTQHGQAS